MTGVERGDWIVDQLPSDTALVLRTAAGIVCERGPIDPESLLATAEGVRRLVAYFPKAASLRASVRQQLLSTADMVGHPAAGLLAGDRETSLLAQAKVDEQLTALVSRVRSQRRRENRAARPSAAARREVRDQTRLKEVSTARDVARRQVEGLKVENEGLRQRIAVLEAIVEELGPELESLRDQVIRDRALAGDSHFVAGQLAAVLRRSERFVPADTRGLQAGEPAHVGLSGAELPDIRSLLDRAAQDAGIPTTVRSGVADWLPALLEAFARPVPKAGVEVIDELELSVDVLGGGDHIGGSCVLISAGGTRILVDAGARPGGIDALTLAPVGIARMEGPPDAIVITHAHNDHGGWVPALVRQYPMVRILGTSGTRDLLRIMWTDSQKILASHRSGSEVPFTRLDVQRAVERFEPVGFAHRQRVGALEVELFPAGHIVGAAGVVVAAGDRRIVVSGDVSGPGQASVGGISMPDSVRGADLFLLESTYAGSGRQLPRTRAVASFVRKVQDVVSGNGRVLVPAFAVGRAQEIAMILAEHLPDVPVLVDGLARSVSQVYEQQQGPDGELLRVFGGNVRRVYDRKREIDSFAGGVIVSTSGMLTSGPAVEWASRILLEAQSSLMIVGHQDEDSPGRALLDLAERGGGDLDLNLAGGGVVSVPVACHVDSYQLGAHASYDELVTIADTVRAGELMLVHGEPRNQRDFERRLDLRGQPTTDARVVWRSKPR